MNSKIFIQIASYRDNQLLPTVRNCISNATYPNNLVFCICWQRDETEQLDEFITDPRFIILNYPYKLARGVGWARNLIQQYYNGEEYTLQLDSHHRFVKNWDTILINMLKNLQKQGYAKPLITAYLPSFDPEDDPNARIQSPWKIVFDKITHEGAVLTKPEYITNWENIKNDVVPAKFYSAHFAFTLGQFSIEVQHDPELYFIGEELNIGARAYTNGYDLFHPNCIIAWHEYTRTHRVKHWDDDKDWWKINSTSMRRNRIMFNIKIKDENNNNIDKVNFFGKYNLGNKRTLEEYIKYIEIITPV